jgi:hypothetical protein
VQKTTANKIINSDVQKRRFALLLPAGYGERSHGGVGGGDREASPYLD